mmetsp:Transcript_86262/g.269899  ORF Transcript_86262/g.269899 Transcript_86262/m.269899 type:complete len:199 (-) Transcript_86262:950-1546(-)
MPTSGHHLRGGVDGGVRETPRLGIIFLRDCTSNAGAGTFASDSEALSGSRDTTAAAAELLACRLARFEVGRELEEGRDSELGREEAGVRRLPGCGGVGVRRIPATPPELSEHTGDALRESWEDPGEDAERHRLGTILFRTMLQRLSTNWCAGTNCAIGNLLWAPAKAMPSSSSSSSSSMDGSALGQEMSKASSTTPSM